MGSVHVCDLVCYTGELLRIVDLFLSYHFMSMYILSMHHDWQKLEEALFYIRF